MDFILAGPIYKLFKYHVNYADIKDSWANQILQRAHTNFKWIIKICKFEWDMGHWPVLRAHHNCGLGLTLGHRLDFQIKL